MKTKKHAIRDAKRAWKSLERLGILSGRWQEHEQVALARSFLKHDAEASRVFEVLLSRCAGGAHKWLFAALTRRAASKIEVAKTLEALQLLRRFVDGKAENKLLEREIGICSNVCTLFPCRHEAQLLNCMSTWPKYSGNRCFPVPGGSSLYEASKDKYEGQYGQLRRELLNFCINRYTENLLEI